MVVTETSIRGRIMTAQKNTPPPAPKVSTTRVPEHPKPKDPKHEEWVIDEGADESFPASDPPSHTQPGPKKKD
jgi:hypothetical protein